MPAILSFLRSWHRDVGSSNEESTDARHSRKGGHHGEISYTSQLLDWRRSRFGHCSFRTRRLLFHREQFGHTYGRNGKRSGYHPDLPGLCAHARCNREGHRPYRRRRRGRRRIGKRRHFCRHQGGRARRPCYLAREDNCQRGNFHDHRGPHRIRWRAATCHG